MINFRAAFGSADILYFKLAGHSFRVGVVPQQAHVRHLLNSGTVGNIIYFLTEPTYAVWLTNFFNDINKLMEDGVDLAQKN